MEHHATNFVSRPATAHRIEDEIGADLVPGTEVMIDRLGATTSQGSSGQNTTVLIPQPTDDPSDPLVSYTSLFFIMVLSALLLFSLSFLPIQIMY